MKRRLSSNLTLYLTLTFLLLALTIRSSPTQAATYREGILLEDSDNATTYYIVDSGKSGPVVLVTAGVHGSEKAPIQAADQMRKWTINQGMMIVVPRCNIQAVEKGERLGAGVDLNRSFPSTSAQKADSPIATALLKLMREQNVDWLIDLHEGLDYSTASSSVGQSIIYMPGSKGSEKFAGQLADTLNKEIKEKDFKFNLLKYPIKGSMARAAADLYSIRSLIFETCRQESLSGRIALQRQAVVELLKYLGMK